MGASFFAPLTPLRLTLCVSAAFRYVVLWPKTLVVYADIPPSYNITEFRPLALLPVLGLEVKVNGDALQVAPPSCKACLTLNPSIPQPLYSLTRPARSASHRPKGQRRRRRRRSMLR